MSNVWNNNLILIKADELAHLVYKETKRFPQQEQYGLISQLRRASISVVVNMIEGHSRFRVKTHVTFLEISFGSLKETHYLIEFSYKEGFVSKRDFEFLDSLCDGIEKMLFTKIRTMKQTI